MKSKYIPDFIFKRLSKSDQDKIIEAEKAQNIHENVKKPKVKQIIKDLFK